MRKFLILLGLMLSVLAAPAQAQWNSGANCQAGQIDTMGWAYPYPAWQQSNGWWSHANHQTYASRPTDWAMGEISSSQGGMNPGATWELTSIDSNGHGLGGDLQRWDANYIYYWNTGGGSTTPDPVTGAIPYYQHWMFDRVIPSMKRCETAGYPGDAIVTMDSYLYITDGTASCQFTADTPVHFGKIRMAFYGPYQMQFGAQSAPQTTYQINYNWGWDGTVYQHREIEYYQQPQGFTEWVGMHWNGTAYEVDSHINKQGVKIEHISDFSAVQPGEVLSQNIGCGGIVPNLFP